MIKKPSINKTEMALLAILAGAAIVRVWGLDFGLPYPWARPDESRLVNMAIKFGQGDLNPPFFNYPTLYPYILTVLFGLYYLLGRLFGAYGSVYDLVVEFATEPTNFYLIDRTLSALTGIATVLIVYHIGKRLFDKNTGLISALFLAFAYLHVRDSHFGVTDVPMTLLIMFSMFFIARAMQTGRLKDYALAGATAGLAASTKYAGFMLLFPMIATHIIIVRREHLPPTKILIDRRMLTFGAVTIAAFFVGTPYALIEFPRFLADVLGEVRHLDSGHMGVVLDRGWWYHLHFSLYYGLGWPLLLASLAGAVLLARTDSRKALVICFFPLVYYLWAGRGHTVFVRYVVPMVPFLCILAAVAIDRVHCYISGKRAPGWARLATPVLVALVLAPSVFRLARFDTLITKPDTRKAAAEWIITSVPEGATIYQANSGVRALGLEPGQYFLERYNRYEQSIAEGYGENPMKGLTSRLVDSLTSAWRYRHWSFNGETGRFLYEGVLLDSLPRFIVTEQAPVKVYNITPIGIARLIQQSYELQQAFIGFDSTHMGIYDQQDRFFIPYACFDGAVRPGPNIFIYERVDRGDQK